MKGFRPWACAFVLVALTVGGIAACEDNGTFGAGTFTLPDSGVVDFDATTAPPEIDAAVDADTAIEPDAGDAGDAGGDASSYPGIIGSETAGLSDDTCPAGQVMVGFGSGQIVNGFYAGVVSSFTTICAAPSLPVGASTTVTIGPGSALPTAPRGAVPPTATAQLTCPENQVVVGLTGSTTPKNFPPAFDLVASVFLRCTPLSYANGVITIGATTTGPGVGGGGTSEGPFDCPAGSIALGTRVHSDDVLNAVETRCAPPTIP